MGLKPCVGEAECGGELEYGQFHSSERSAPSMMIPGSCAWRVARRGAATASLLLAVAAIASGCGGSPSHVGGSAPATNPPTTSPSQSSSSTSFPTTRSVEVSEGDGSTLLVKASPVVSALYVNVSSFLWSAAPGQVFLTDTLTVTNPSGGHVENLSDFDDVSSGLADDVDFVMSASNAAMAGDSSACGARQVYPPSLCPISLGQGLTVDTDTANHDGRAGVQLPAGSSTQITLSYGPVAATLQPATVSAYFDDGQSTPVDLTP